MKTIPALVSFVVVTTALASPARAAVDRGAAETLTQLATVAAANVEGTEVLSSRDIEEIVALEADKQLVGCTDDSACLAEVAGALGARFVVFSQLGELDATMVLTLNLFDANETKSIGRQIVQGGTVSELGEGVGAAVTTLVGDAVLNAGATADGAPLKVLVMDIRIAGQAPTEAGDKADTTAPPTEPGFPILLASGGGLIGFGALLGGLGVGLGVVAMNEQAAASAPETRQTDVLQHVGLRDVTANLANTSYLLGGAAALVGIALVGVSFAVEGE